MNIIESIRSLFSRKDTFSPSVENASGDSVLDKSNLPIAEMTVFFDKVKNENDE